MYLDKPAFPVLFSFGQIVQELEKRLSQNGWKNTHSSVTSLLYRPFWVYRFEIFEEQEGAGVTHLHSGGMILDAQNPVFTSFETMTFSNLVHNPHEPEGGIEVEIQKPLLQKEDAVKMSKLHLAAKYAVRKNQVLLTDLQMLYFPAWKLSATLESQPVDFLMDASSGKLLMPEEIPPKPKTHSDLVEEALSELSSPGQWLNYSSALLASTLHFFAVSRWRVIGLLLVVGALILFLL